MILRICLTLLAAWLILPPSSAVANCGDTEVNSGSLSADIHRILDAPATVGDAGGPAIPADSSLDYYYSKRTIRSADTPLLSLYGVTEQRRGPGDSSVTSKKPPKPGPIPEPHPVGLLAAGALGWIATRGRRAR